MGERTSKNILLIAGVWLVIALILGTAYKFLIHPLFTEQLKDETGSESQYKHKINIAADSFSGYCVLRSKRFAGELKTDGIQVAA